MAGEQELNQGSKDSAPVAAQPPKNLLRDMFGIILEPQKSYQRILGVGYWVGMVIVILLVSAALEQVYHTQTINLTLEKMQENVAGNPDAAQGAMQFYQNEAITRPVYFAITIIGQIVALLIGTVLYFFVASVIFGGTAKFKQVWIVAVWGYVIVLLQMIIKTPLILAKNSIEAGLNFGLIFTEQMVGSKLHNAFGAVDLFGIWHFIVVGLGLAVLYKFPSKKGIGVAFIVWLLLTAIGAAVGYFA